MSSSLSSLPPPASSSSEHPCRSPRLLWAESAVKQHFLNREWPTFLGIAQSQSQQSKNSSKDNKHTLTEEQALQQQISQSSTSGNSSSAMPLPVMLWPEQARSNNNNDNIDNIDNIDSNKSNDSTGSIANNSENKKRKADEAGIDSLSPHTHSHTHSHTHDLSHSTHNDNDDSNNINDKAALTAHCAGERETAFSRRAVYASLHSRGYFLGPGDVYGGDYCLYKGASPCDAHSLATVRVCAKGKIAATDLLAFSRVQNQVAKSAVLAFPRTEPSTSSVSVCVSTEEQQKEKEKESESSPVGFVVLNFRSVSVRS